MTAPQMRGNVRATAANPSQSRSKDFPGTARRLLGRLAPQRRQWLAVLVLAVGGIVLSLAPGRPVSVFVTSISFAIYLICWLLGSRRPGAAE